MCLGSIFIFLKHEKIQTAKPISKISVRKTGLSQTQIASIVGVHKSTICRELKRNTPIRGRTAGQYIGEHAKGKTDLRHLLKAKQIFKPLYANI